MHFDVFLPTWAVSLTQFLSTQSIRGDSFHVFLRAQSIWGNCFDTFSMGTEHPGSRLNLFYRLLCTWGGPFDTFFADEEPAWAGVDAV